MKKLLVLGAIVFALMAAGVIHFQKSGDQVNISIDKGKLKEVSNKWIDEGNRMIDQAQDRLDERRHHSTDPSDEMESEFRSQTRRFTPSRSR